MSLSLSVRVKVACFSPLLVPASLTVCFSVVSVGLSLGAKNSSLVSVCVSVGAGVGLCRHQCRFVSAWVRVSVVSVGLSLSLSVNFRNTDFRNFKSPVRVGDGVVAGVGKEINYFFSFLYGHLRTCFWQFLGNLQRFVMSCWCRSSYRLSLSAGVDVVGVVTGVGAGVGCRITCLFVPVSVLSSVLLAGFGVSAGVAVLEFVLHLCLVFL